VQLAPNYGALFAKKIYDLLVGLERAIPGYGKKIACLGEGFEGKYQEGEESRQEQNQEAWRHKGDVRSCLICFWLLCLRSLFIGVFFATRTHV
jgi:hypothetical protein